MKFVRVNMSDKTISIDDVPPDYVGLGGRGLTSVMINAEVPPKCNPLGPENKLIFAPGLLTGTSLVNTSRLSGNRTSVPLRRDHEKAVAAQGPGCLPVVGVFR